MVTREQDDIQWRFQFFNTLLKREIPSLYEFFTGLKIPIESFLEKWISCLFLNILPFNLALRVWDIILLKGEAYVYQVTLGIFKYLESDLLNSKIARLEEIFARVKEAEEQVIFLIISSVKVSVHEFEEQLILQRMGEQKGQILMCYAQEI